MKSGEPYRWTSLPVAQSRDIEAWIASLKTSTVTLDVTKFTEARPAWLDRHAGLGRVGLSSVELLVSRMYFSPAFIKRWRFAVGQRSFSLVPYAPATAGEDGQRRTAWGRLWSLLLAEAPD